MATLVTLAQNGMYGDHMDGGWAWGMMVMALVTIVALVVWFVRSFASAPAHSAPGHGPGGETPMQVLDRRLASGEITPEEHQERAAILDNK